jgi:hypothetical protein
MSTNKYQYIQIKKLRNKGNIEWWGRMWDVSSGHAFVVYRMGGNRTKELKK